MTFRETDKNGLVDYDTNNLVLGGKSFDKSQRGCIKFYKLLVESDG